MNASLLPYSLRVVVVLVALFVAGCDTLEAQEEFVDRANLPPSGYTHTDDDGNVEREDEDDWRSAPIYGPRVRVEPAYPNPAGPSDFVNVGISVSDLDVVHGPLRLVTYSEGRQNLIDLDVIEEPSLYGFYNFTFSAGLLGTPRLYRLYVLDGRNEIVSYGDLLIDG